MRRGQQQLIFITTATTKSIQTWSEYISDGCLSPPKKNEGKTTLTLLSTVY